jgi:hypothetical protein
MTAATARVVTLRPAPRREPPFDDEVERPYLHLVGRGDQRLPFPPPSSTLVSGDIRPAELPDPARWARQLLIGLSETAGGRRPFSQAAALLAPTVVKGLGDDFARAAALGRRHWLDRAVVRTVHVTEPARGVAELAATLQAGSRVRAVALRLEARHGRWRCTRLETA